MLKIIKQYLHYFLIGKCVFCCINFQYYILSILVFILLPICFVKIFGVNNTNMTEKNNCKLKTRTITDIWNNFPSYVTAALLKIILHCSEKYVKEHIASFNIYFFHKAKFESSLFYCDTLNPLGQRKIFVVWAEEWIKSTWPTFNIQHWA